MAITVYFYLRGRADISSQSLSWTGDTIKIALLDNTYTPSPTGHNYFSDVSAYELPASGGYAGGVALASKTLSIDTGNNRVEFQAADVTAWNAATFTGARYAVVYKDTGTPATSAIIGVIDFGVDEDAPITIKWPAGDGAFAIGV